MENCFTNQASESSTPRAKCLDINPLFSDIQNEQIEEETESSVNKETKCDKIYPSVGKLDINARSRRKISILAHKLKRLSHEGEMDRFTEIVTAVTDRCMMKKLKLAMCVRSNMEIYDIIFTILDAQIEARRLKYDTTLTDSEIFSQMQHIISLTSNPTSSSMTYLARLGSAISMKTKLDDGLAFLQFAKQHSIQISPCKETGMVFYINANLLSQKLELCPSEEMKTEVLNTIEHAMTHFRSETDDVRNDFSRMLMLKKAYCYLGLNLFGKNIKEISVSEDDRKSAKVCFDFIENPDIWNRMECRRKMLYHIAKAEYYRQGKLVEFSSMHANMAFKLAEENSWTAELPNIVNLIKEIENTSQEDFTDGHSVDEIIEQMCSIKS